MRGGTPCMRAALKQHRPPTRLQGLVAGGGGEEAGGEVVGERGDAGGVIGCGGGGQQRGGRRCSAGAWAHAGHRGDDRVGKITQPRHPTTACMGQGRAPGGCMGSNGGPGHRGRRHKLQGRAGRRGRSWGGLALPSQPLPMRCTPHNSQLVVLTMSSALGAAWSRVRELASPAHRASSRRAGRRSDMATGTRGGCQGPREGDWRLVGARALPAWASKPVLRWLAQGSTPTLISLVPWACSR